MGRASSIETNLPEEVRIAVNTQLEAGHTLDQILGYLEEMGHEEDVSRSALGRYKMKHNELAGELRRTREVAKALGREFGEDTDSEIGRVAIELLQAVQMKTIAAAAAGRTPDFSPQELHFLGRTSKDLMSALSIDDARVAKIKAEERKRVLAEVEAAVDETIKGGGLTKQTAENFRNTLLKLDV